MTQAYANVGDVPLALAVFLASDHYDHDPAPNTISTTTLLKSLRQIILPARIPAGVAMPNLADMMNSRMGSAIHDGIEKAWITNHEPAMAALGYPKRVIDRVRVNPKDDELTDDIIPIYLEQRLKRQMGKWLITGKFDFVGEGRVQDFKTTSVWTYKNQVNANKYIQQGSVYRWLNSKMIHQDEMDIHYIFTDWKGGMQKTDPSYPPRRFHKQSFPLMSLGETEQFIRTKINLIDQHWETEEELLPPCDDEELWRGEPIFKYYKSGDITKSRSTKNFDTRQEAVIFMTTNGNTGAIKEVPGQVTACKYCPAFAICSQKDALIASGDLLMG